MGVSVRAYFELERVHPTEHELENGEAWDYAVKHDPGPTPEFHRSYLGLESGAWYSTEVDHAEILSMSYIGYGLFRESIAGMFGVVPKDYWRGPYEDEPFYELINFFDNEGMIGPVACAELAKDFEEFKDEYADYLSTISDKYQEDRYLQVFDRFREATRRISEGTGFIAFS